MVAVVEEAHIPAGVERVEERDERARPLGELEPVQELVRHRRAPAGEVADVQLGELVGAEVGRFEPALAERADRALLVGVGGGLD